MKPWQARVLIEKTELAQKLKDLETFLNSDTNKKLIQTKDLELLYEQEAFMHSYLEVLNERIARFTND